MSDSKLDYTSNVNFNITDFLKLKRDNLNNVKEYNVTSFKNPNLNYGKLPERENRPPCFKCQKPQFVCHDAFIPKDFSKNNQLKDYHTEPITAEKLIKLQKGADVEEENKQNYKKTNTINLTNDVTLDKNIELEKTDKERKNIEDEVKNQEKIEEQTLQKIYEQKLQKTKLKGCSQCIKQDNKDYLKYKNKYKQNYKKK